MRSKTLWLTDLGLSKIDSGELSPGLDPIKLRFYPEVGLGADEWTFELGINKGNKTVTLIDTTFVDEDRCFELSLQFKETHDVVGLVIFATHSRTGFKKVAWEGDVVPNVIHVTCKVNGLSQRNWDVLGELKNTYPHVNPSHFKLPKIDVLITQDSILVATAKSELEHVVENAPITVKGFHKFQEFNLLVNGHVFGYGGMGGNAGISTVVGSDLDIVYPTDGFDGGNPIYVEHATQKVDVVVSRFGCFLAGMGGKGASSFCINNPTKRTHQIGHPGIGGYPNGLNGEVTPIHYKLGLVKESVGPVIKPYDVNHLGYGFEEGVYKGHDLPVYLDPNSSVKQTKDGKQGSVKTKGVNSLLNKRTLPFVTRLVYAYGTYVEL